MGSWNSTCAITNLPIFYGEEVYVFLLQAKPIPTSKCYPDFLYGVLPIHFEGTYDDYGAVENCKGPLLNTLMNIIMDNLVEMPLSDYDKVKVTKSNLNVKTLFEFDHLRTLFVNEYKKVALTHIQIKKHVLDTIIREYKVTIYNPKYDVNKPYGGDNVGTINVGYDYLYNAVNEYIIPLQEDVLNQKHDWYIQEKFFTMDNVRHGLITTPYRLLMSFLNGELENVTTNDFIHQNIVDYILNKYMEDSRGVWTPSSGAGSQDDSTTAQELRAKLIIKSAKMCNNRWNDE